MKQVREEGSASQWRSEGGEGVATAHLESWNGIRHVDPRTGTIPQQVDDAAFAPDDGSHLLVGQQHLKHKQSKWEV